MVIPRLVGRGVRGGVRRRGEPAAGHLAGPVWSSFAGQTLRTDMGAHRSATLYYSGRVAAAVTCPFARRWT